jgi:hypothetical protein
MWYTQVIFEDELTKDDGPQDDNCIMNCVKLWRLNKIIKVFWSIQVI